MAPSTTARLTSATAGRPRASVTCTWKVAFSPGPGAGSSAVRVTLSWPPAAGTRSWTPALYSSASPWLAPGKGPGWDGTYWLICR